VSRKLENLKILPHLASLWLIARSRIFDANWYRREYSDCAAAGLNPMVHYLLEGARQGARPHLLFDPVWYGRRRGATQKHPDPLIDYIRYGAAEGYEPSPYFSSEYYCKSAGPLHGLTPLGHFIAYGLPRKVSPTPLFDRNWYLAANPDVRRAGFEPLLHFVASGARDGRSPGPLFDAAFDAAWYRFKNADIRDCGLQPLQHYLAVGATEGRKPHECFDPAFYVAQAPGAGVKLENALIDYAERGCSNWRSSHKILPPPASPVAAFDDFPWRRSGSSRAPLAAPFLVLVVNLPHALSNKPPRSAALWAQLIELPQLDLHMLADAPDSFEQDGVATLDLSRSEFASLDGHVVLDRLLRALKFRNPNALVIEAECAIAPLKPICESLALPYHLIESGKTLTAADWAALLRRRIGYREAPPQTISAIVPNYNHARYLEERLGSIFAQRLQPNEIIFLDDGSSDDSLDIAEAWKAKSKIPFTILSAKSNSGSPFKQWAKGVLEANCELVWIAESDDSSDPRFLERMAASFLDPDVVLAYSDSETIGAEGQSLSKSYRFYTDTLDETKWQCGYVESGPTEIATALAVKNTIPNVSAAIFRREALRSVVEAIQEYRYCGDWRAYVECLGQGKIAFCPQPLNRHRQDPGSVTQEGERATLAVREALAIKRAIFSDFAVTDRVVWLSLAQTIFEYELRSRALPGGRPAFADNADLAEAINDMSGVIEQHRAGYAKWRDETAGYLRRLAEEQPSLDKAARNMIIARAMAALSGIAGRSV
jgi:Glycosyl transferase family 2